MKDTSEDQTAKNFSDRQSYQALLNVLDDFDEDRQYSKQTNWAILNILEDFDDEKKRLSNTNSAVINILEDLDESRAKTEYLNTQLEALVNKRTQELSKSEERFRLLVEGVKDYAIIILDEKGNVATWNPGAERIKGYRANEILGQHFSTFYTLEDQANRIPQEELKLALKNTQLKDEGWRVRKDGSKFIADIVITALRDEEGDLRGYGMVTRDVSERKAAEESAREALRQEMLLKEIHHRVKNNLQVISSLLFLQSTMIKDPVVLDILSESQGRVKSIALIHEKLYRSDDLEKLAFDDYVNDLLIEIKHSYNIRPESISLHIETESVQMGVDAAIPCGLIINELASNAFKHAFPGEATGNVWIKIFKIETGSFRLDIRDDGIGFDKGIKWQQYKSLGLKLVVDLTKQLDGELLVESEHGTHFQLTFTETQYKDRQ